MKLTDEDIEVAAQQALRASLGAPDSDVGQARLRNLEAYNAEAKGEFAPPEIEGRLKPAPRFGFGEIIFSFLYLKMKKISP